MSHNPQFIDPETAAERLVEASENLAAVAMDSGLRAKTVAVLIADAFCQNYVPRELHPLAPCDTHKQVALDSASMMRELAEQFTAMMHNEARFARLEGAKWAEIGKAVGVSGARAQQRYAKGQP